MIDLRAGLGAPPIVFPGVRMQHTDAPPMVQTGAPLMPIGQTAASAAGCPPSTGMMGVGDLQSWWGRIPMWVKIGGGLLLATGVGYGVYRLVR